MDNMIERSQNLVEFSYEFSALPEEKQVEKATELFMVLFLKFEPAELFCMANKLHKAEEFVGAEVKLIGIQETLNNEKEHEKPIKHAPAPEIMSVTDLWNVLKPYMGQLGSGLTSGLNSVSDFVYDIGANLADYKEFTSSQLALNSAFIHEKANIKITERVVNPTVSDKSKILFFGKSDPSSKLAQSSKMTVNVNHVGRK